MSAVWDYVCGFDEGVGERLKELWHPFAEGKADEQQQQLTAEGGANGVHTGHDFSHSDELLSFESTCRALAHPPEETSVRVDLTKVTVDEALQRVRDYIAAKYKDVAAHADVTVSIHPVLSDVLIMPLVGPRTPTKQDVYAVVDMGCGMAVLRGADVFAPGVVAAHPGMKEGDCVSVYANVSGHFTTGDVAWHDEATVAYLGNGRCVQGRATLFCQRDAKAGLAIEMTDPVFLSPCLSELDTIVQLQNVPSCVAAHLLGVERNPTWRVLDMCAAPGGKTIHIASLMRGNGEIHALERSRKRATQLADKVAEYKNIQVHHADATKCIKKGLFEAESFDAVLLDAPCSGLGQRPRFHHPFSRTDFDRSSVYQQKLADVAIEALKPGGALVYSTCTINPEENEGVVSYILQNHGAAVQLEPQEPYRIGDPGMMYPGLTPTELRHLQRFYPDKHRAIGFFLAKFTKLPKM
eukprot:m.68228 g.68228  ORF g.68228 m.68228 type:complete len:466 (-) comp12191_c1_seq2:1748-3145(-)